MPATETRSYAGLGARATPAATLRIMARIGVYLAERGLTLRSGAAEGADQAFEWGAAHANGPREIFLPWAGFNAHKSRYCQPPQTAFNIARGLHPNPEKLSRAAFALHARNIQQVMGPSLDSPSVFVLCWTQGGQIMGGTATAIQAANMHHIPVINLGEDAFQGLDPASCVKAALVRVDQALGMPAMENA